MLAAHDPGQLTKRSAVEPPSKVECLDMGPTLLIDYVADRSCGDTVLFGEHPSAAGSVGSNGSDLGVAQLSPAILSAYRSHAVHHHVGMVFFRRAPDQIGQAIVVVNTVKVSRLSALRSQPCKRL
jgi:hypothetical protein